MLLLYNLSLSICLWYREDAGQSFIHFGWIYIYWITVKFTALREIKSYGLYIKRFIGCFYFSLIRMYTHKMWLMYECSIYTAGMIVIFSTIHILYIQGIINCKDLAIFFVVFWLCFSYLYFSNIFIISCCCCCCCPPFPPYIAPSYI